MGYRINKLSTQSDINNSINAIDVKLVNVKKYKASGSLKSTTGNINLSTPTTLTLTSAMDFENGQGIAINYAGAPCTLPTPSAPTVTPTGTTGSTTYQYQIVAFDGNGGCTASSTAGVTATGNAQLSATNYNALSWNPVTLTTTGTINTTTSSISLTVGSAENYVIGQNITISGAGLTSTTGTIDTAINNKIVNVASAINFKLGQTIIINGAGTTTTTGSIDIATSPTTVNVASENGFVAGQTITINGAGASGANLTTTITNVTGTKIGIADAASTSVTGATVTVAALTTTITSINGTAIGITAAASNNVTDTAVTVATDLNTIITSINGTSIGIGKGASFRATNAAVAVTVDLYAIYGKSNGSMNLLAIITDGTTTWNDTGVSAITPPVTSVYPPTAPTSFLAGTLYTKVISGGGTVTLTLANAATTAVTGQNVYHDDTDAINTAVEAANNYINGSTDATRNNPDDITKRGGTVYFPPGIYNVRTINVKAGIKYTGAGTLATRFNPIGLNGYVFDRDKVEKWVALVTFEDFTIAPNDEHFAFTGKNQTPPPVGGFNLNLVSAASINRVYMLNIAGHGIHMAECYDSYINNMEIIYVGDNKHAGIGMYPGIAIPGGRSPSIIDLTNAIHVSHVRIEDCTTGLDIDGSKYVNKIQREIQFVGCKFEGAVVKVKHVFGVTFSACNVTPHGAFTQSQGAIPHVIIGEDGSYDTRGVQFIGCSCVSGTTDSRWVFDIRGSATYDFKIIGGSVTGVKYFLKQSSGGQPIHITGVSCVSGGTPFIQVTKKLRLSDCTFYNMVGGDYVVIAGDESNIINNDFTRIDKGVSMGANCFSTLNKWNTINVHAHYVSSGGNVIERQRYEGGVVKEVEYSTASLSLVTFKPVQLTNPAPAGYNEYPFNVTAGVSGTYGSATSVTTLSWSYFTNPSFKAVVGGTFGASETLTLKIEATYDDGTTAFIEKAFTATTTGTWLTLDEVQPLIKSRLHLRSFKLYTKTTDASTSTTCAVRVIANIH